MGYLVELDPLYGLIRWPQPEPDAPEVVEETAAATEILPEAAASTIQAELDL